MWKCTFKSVDDAQHQRKCIRVGGQQEPQRMRQRQHPLSQRSLGQHLISQQRGGLGHAPRTAGRTKPALLATEGHQLLGVAVLADQAQEPFLQAAALEVCVELLLNVVRQWPAHPGAQFTECRIVLLDQPIQQRAFRSMARVA
jgi:hypothetical protein